MRCALGPLLVLALTACTTARVPTQPVQLGPRDAYVLPMRVYEDGQVWFSDELEVVEDAVAAYLERAGFRVVDPELMRRFRKNVLQGLLPGRKGRCPAPPPPAELTKAFFRGAKDVEVDLGCEGPACTLTISVYAASAPHTGQGKELRRFITAVPPGTGPKLWAQAIEAGALLEVPVPEAMGMGGLGVGNVGSRGDGLVVNLLNPDHAGPWAEKLSSAVLEPHKEALHACAQTDTPWHDWWAMDYVIEVSPGGRVTRCEANLPDRLPPAGFGCRCDVMKARLQLPKGSAGRRARFRITTADLRESRARGEDALFRSAYLSGAESEDAALLSTTNALSHRGVHDCLRAAPSPIGEHEIPVRFEVGGDGEALSFAADWPPEVPAPLRACLEGEFAKARFTCPIGQRAGLRTQLDLSLITLEELRRRRD